MGDIKQEGAATDLGLSGFLAGNSEVTPVETPEIPKEDTSPVAKTEGKAEAPKEVLAKEEGEEKKAAETPKEEAKKPSFDWESDDNPYKKQYKDTRDWATSVNREKAELTRQVGLINKKLDGTYDPETDEPKTPSQQDLTQGAEIAGKIKASRRVASEIYGEENIKKLIFDENAPFRRIENDPYVAARVLSADAPVLEAMKILEERAFYAKWGNNPSEIETSIRKKAEEELTQQLTEKITKQVMDRFSLKERQSPGLGDARASEGNKSTTTGPPSLTSIFG